MQELKSRQINTSFLLVHVWLSGSLLVGLPVLYNEGQIYFIKFMLKYYYFIYQNFNLLQNVFKNKFSV